MKKTTWLLIVFVVILLLLTIFWLLSGLGGGFSFDRTDRTTDGGSGGDFSDFPTGDGSTPGDNQFDTNNSTDTPTLTLATEDGEIVVNNILNRSDTVDRGSNMYAIGGLYPTAATSYAILFNDNNDSFAISIEEPLRESREEVEQYLQDILGIGATDLCQLNALVGVTVDVNQYYSGQNLGFSMCPGSVDLP